MNIRRHGVRMRFAPGAIGIALLAACSSGKPNQGAAISFDTPEQAVAALVSVLRESRPEELQRLLGPGTDSLVSSGDAVADRTARTAFLKLYNERHELVAGTANDLALHVGTERWPLPIPLVRREGRWHFDGAAGADEIVLRRIGANELHTIEVIRGFLQAQSEYAAVGHDGAPAGSYAQRVRSRPGKQDGLFWEVGANDPPSPLGPLVADAAEEGYSGDQREGGYHGYRYRMLFAQGPAASGGAQSYLVDGQLRTGFALLAYPNAYGASGFMTFLVSQDGVIWQRDLGPQTTQRARAITQFDPDTNWTPLVSQ